MTKKQLISKIHGILEDVQFFRNGLLWNRRLPDFIDVIDLQISKSKDMFTINIGVADRFTSRVCWGLIDADVVDEASCTVRARLGALLYGRDVWWSLEDSECLDHVLRALQDVAFPFLQTNHRIDHMIETLENDPAAGRYPPGVIYLALLYYRKGERARSKEMFNSMKLTGAWSKKAANILDTLN